MRKVHIEFAVEIAGYVSRQPPPEKIGSIRNYCTIGRSWKYNVNETAGERYLAIKLRDDAAFAWSDEFGKVCLG